MPGAALNNALKNQDGQRGPNGIDEDAFPLQHGADTAVGRTCRSKGMTTVGPVTTRMAPSSTEN